MNKKVGLILKVILGFILAGIAIGYWLCYWFWGIGLATW